MLNKIQINSRIKLRGIKAIPPLLQSKGKSFQFGIYIPDAKLETFCILA